MVRFPCSLLNPLIKIRRLQPSHLKRLKVRLFFEGRTTMTARDVTRFYAFSPFRNLQEKKAHKHKLFALVTVQMALGQTAGCPGVNRAKKFMCSPRNTGNINFSLWSTGGLSQGCPDFQKVYVFKVYVPFSCPKIRQISPHLKCSVLISLLIVQKT